MAQVHLLGGIGLGRTDDPAELERLRGELGPDGVLDREELVVVEVGEHHAARRRPCAPSPGRCRSGSPARRRAAGRRRPAPGWAAGSRPRRRSERCGWSRAPPGRGGEGSTRRGRCSPAPARWTPARSGSGRRSRRRRARHRVRRRLRSPRPGPAPRATSCVASAERRTTIAPRKYTSDAYRRNAPVAVTERGHHVERRHEHRQPRHRDPDAQPDSADPGARLAGEGAHDRCPQARRAQPGCVAGDGLHRGCEHDAGEDPDPRDRPEPVDEDVPHVGRGLAGSPAGRTATRTADRRSAARRAAPPRRP